LPFPPRGQGFGWLREEEEEEEEEEMVVEGPPGTGMADLVGCNRGGGRGYPHLPTGIKILPSCIISFEPVIVYTAWDDAKQIAPEG
jgi:hypothetical protein